MPECSPLDGRSADESWDAGPDGLTLVACLMLDLPLLEEPCDFAVPGSLVACCRGRTTTSRVAVARISG